MSTEYEAVIGLEVHAQLLTESKLFCSCSAKYGAAPNRHVCPVCLGLPGALPVLNEHATRLAVRAALALGCTIHSESLFARKNYFYPDLPKGYQISQFERPFSTHGHLDVANGEAANGSRRIGITRVHMEEDAGKNVHGVGGDSLVDLNRAGVPLIEIVGEPELRTSREAADYLRALREILMFVGVNDGNLEEGSFRCDANVSIRPRGSTELGTRTELKNLNSFRFVARALDSEIARQIAVVEGGGEVRQETRSFDPDSGATAALRSKEEAHDYRYFPEPDLPPFVVDDAFVERERALIGELPAELRARWTGELGVSAQAATTLAAHPATAGFFQQVVKLGGDPLKASNWILTEVLRGTRAHGLEAEFPVTPAVLVELIELVESGRISGKQAKEVYAAIEGTDRKPAEVVSERGLQVVSDESELLPLCRALIEEHPREAASVRAGKKGVLGFFVGQVMRRTQGSADPKLVNSLLEKLLKEES